MIRRHSIENALVVDAGSWMLVGSFPETEDENKQHGEHVHSLVISGTDTVSLV